MTTFKTTPWDHQRRALTFALARPACMLAMGMGPQPLDATVLTPSGFQPIGWLKVGDSVIGSSGEPTDVLEVIDFPDDQRIWTVYMSDGSSTRCTEKHLWTVSTPKMRCKGSPPVTMTLKEISSSLHDVNGNRRWFIPMVAPVIFETLKSLLIDPWFLGALLGDGTMSNTGVQFTDDDEGVVHSVGVALKNHDSGLRMVQYANIQWGLSNQRGRGNSLLEALRILGLTGRHSYDKFIPTEYLLAPPINRLQLIQGLCDTDGYVQDGMNTVEYSSSSPLLANDFLFLVRSFGGRGAMVKKETACRPSYRIHFSLPVGMNPFAHSKSVAKFRPRTKYFPSRAIESVTPAGAAKVRCIRVAAPDGLYVTDDFIVTHNTGKSKVTIDLLAELQARRVLIVSPKSVLTVWPAQFSTHDPRSTHLEVLRTGTIATRTQRMRDTLAWSEASGKPTAVVVNYDAVWREPLGSEVLKVPWDVIVLDESHRVKAPGSRVSWFFRTLGRRVRRKLCLTGTPMPNSPLDLYGQYRFLDPRVFGTSFAIFRSQYAVMGGFEQRQVVAYKNKEDFHRRFASIAFQAGRELLDLPKELHVERRFDLSPKARKIYNDLEEQFVAEVDAGIITVSNALVKLLRLQQITSGHIGDEDGTVHDVDRGKAELLSDVLEDLGPEEPCVVFCRFRRDLELTREVALSLDPPRKSSELSGSENTLAEWQAGASTVLAVQVQAGGLGVDFTRARYCVFYSLGFSLGEYEQACARVLRPGQTKNVTYLHLVASETVDEKLYGALSRKRHVVDEILTGITTRKEHGRQPSEALRGAREAQAGTFGRT